MTDPLRCELYVDPRVLPDWYQTLARALEDDSLAEMIRFQLPADTAARSSAVLVLFADGPGGPEVLLIERAADMRSHAGQTAFPGGAHELTDTDLVATALRESWEETGLLPEGVTVVASLPEMWLPPSGFVVTPVLGYWHAPSPVRAADPAEVAAVHRIAVAQLVDPGNRVRVTHPSGYTGPGFQVAGMLVWGFTGMLLDRLIAIAGWERSWQGTAREVPFDDGWRRPVEGGEQ